MHRLARVVRSAPVAALSAPLLALLLTLPVPASAQWAWKDGNGRLVFSDRPPPSGTPQDKIVQQPGRAAAAAAPAAGADALPATTPAPAAAAAPQKTALELDAEFRKRQADKAASDKKAADQAAAAQEKTAACARSRASLQQLQDGIRMRAADGGIMGDDERSAETARLQRELGERC